MSDTLIVEPEDSFETKEEFQRELERLYSKNQLIPRIRAEFTNCKEIEFSAYFQEHDIPEEFGFGLLVQMALHKRATLPTLVGVLYHHLQDSQATADMLARAAKADLVDWDEQLRIFIVVFTISEDVQEDINRFQYPLPMVVPPKPVRHNRESGYLLNNTSVILRHNHHDQDVCLDHLNRMNQIRFSINQNVVAMVKNTWRNLDKCKAGETREKFEKRKRAFEKYDRTARDVIALITAAGNEFYLTHRYDKRGRTYSSGYHINYQGNPWNKACIEFTEKEIVT